MPWPRSSTSRDSPGTALVSGDRPGLLRLPLRTALCSCLRSAGDQDQLAHPVEAGPWLRAAALIGRGRHPRRDQGDRPRPRLRSTSCARNTSSASTATGKFAHLGQGILQLVPAPQGKAKQLPPRRHLRRERRMQLVQPHEGAVEELSSCSTLQPDSDRLRSLPRVVQSQVCPGCPQLDRKCSSAAAPCSRSPIRGRALSDVLQRAPIGAVIFAAVSLLPRTMPRAAPADRIRVACMHLRVAVLRPCRAPISSSVACAR